MKAVARFYVCLVVIVACVVAARQLTRDRAAEHERAMKASETCGGFREQKLTEPEAFPRLPSEREWVRDLEADVAGQWASTWLQGVPMCRYQGERGCWIPMSAYTAPCSKVFPNGMPKE